MSNDSFEYEFLFRPQIGGRSSQGDGYGRTGNRASLLSQIRRASKRSGAALASGAKARYDVGETPRNSRRCVVKSHYVSMARGGRLAAGQHLAYLERDGVERDGSPGRLYGPDEAFDSEAFAEPVKGEKRQFRFIVSPENDAQIDLHAFARDLVAQMEKDLGRRLVRAAVSVTDGERVPVTFFSARPRTTLRRVLTADHPFEPLILFRPRIAGCRSKHDPHSLPRLRFSVLSRMKLGLAASAGRPGSKSHDVSTGDGGRAAAGLNLTCVGRVAVERDSSPSHLRRSVETFARGAFVAPEKGRRRELPVVVSLADGGGDR